MVNMFDTEEMCDKHFNEGAYAPVIANQEQPKINPDEEVVSIDADIHEDVNVNNIADNKGDNNNDSRTDLPVSE